MTTTLRAKLAAMQAALNEAADAIGVYLKAVTESEAQPPEYDAPIVGAPVVATATLNKTVAICVGHSRSGDDGAESAGGVSEWDYNRKVATILAEILPFRGIRGVVIDSYGGSGYSAAMADCGRQVKAAKADVAIELHFNSANGQAQGFEFIAGSESGMKLAKCFVERFAALTTIHDERHNRGAKKPQEGRGAGFFEKTPCPAVICEPFFGDHAGQWTFWANHQDALAKAYADALENYFQTA